MSEIIDMDFEDVGFRTESGHLVIPGPHKTNWLQIFAWSMYDLANTIFSLAVVSMTIASYIVILGVHQGIQESIGRIIFAVAGGIANIIVAFLLPVIGLYSDRSPSRKRPLVIITLFTIGATAALGLTGEYWTTLFLFLAANIAYQLSLVIYDNMIPYIATREDTGKVSALGVALGYLGSFVGLGISFYLLAKGYHDISLENKDVGYAPALYPLAALAFLIFAIPILFVKEHVRIEPPVPKEEIRKVLKTPPTIELAKKGLTELYDTIKDVYHTHREMLIYVIGWLIYVEVANTVILYMGDILREVLLLPKEQNIIILAAGIFWAVVLTYPVGIITEKIGPKKGFKMITAFWLLAFFFGIFVNFPDSPISLPKEFAYLMAFFIGPALGGGWVVNRQYVIELAPNGKTGKYFGLTQVGGRASAAIGSVLWSGTIWLVERIFGWQNKRYYSFRIGLLVIILLLLLGQFIISQVNDYHEDFLKRTRPWDLDPEYFDKKRRDYKNKK